LNGALAVSAKLPGSQGCRLSVRQIYQIFT
jgi:hypothetical protein